MSQVIMHNGMKTVILKVHKIHTLGKTSQLCLYSVYSRHFVSLSEKNYRKARIASEIKQQIVLYNRGDWSIRYLSKGLQHSRFLLRK